MNNDFSNVTVGQKLWSIQLGECEVVRISNNGNEILCGDSDSVKCSYQTNGKRFFNLDKFPSLFFLKPDCFKTKVNRKVEMSGWINPIITTESFRETEVIVALHKEGIKDFCVPAKLSFEITEEI